MNVVFLMRYDFREKRGGDVVQVEAYSVELEVLGYKCSIQNRIDKEIIKNNDVFILVNIDRPVETLNYFESIKKSSENKMVLVVPIHHPIEAINSFESQLKGAAFSLFCRVVPNFYGREKVKNFVRFRRNPRWIATSLRHLVFDYVKKITEILSRADGIVYISDGERISVEQDFGFKNKSYVIAYNAVGYNGSIQCKQVDKIYDIVVVGRIEQRKNQLRIAKVLARKDIRVIFVGPPNSNSINYYEEFLEVVSSSPNNLSYVGGKSHRETIKIIAQSKSLLNASYFEVNPLVDLEAALMQTQVITTIYSYTKESIPLAIEVDPWNDQSILDGINTALATDIDTLKGAIINTSWMASAEKIDRLIKRQFATL